MGWKSRAFSCDECKHQFDDLVWCENGVEGKPDPCPKCKSTGGFTRQLSAPAIVTNIVVDYPGSKRLKAGYQHTHNRPLENSRGRVRR